MEGVLEMNNEEIKRIVGNPDHIASIYNYCDRWCERCRFTSRCSVYQMTDRQGVDSGEVETNGMELWGQLAASFQDTKELIKEVASNRGIALSSMDATNDYQKEPKDHPLAQLARAYSNGATQWFEDSAELFNEIQSDLQSKLHMGLKESDPIADSVGFNDAMDVVRWYHSQIYAKFIRAIQGLSDVAIEDKEGLSPHSNGSAKVALTAIDRSLSAWGELYSQLPSQRGAILEFLVQLDGMSKFAHKIFPNAMMFRRPGFDEDDI